MSRSPLRTLLSLTVLVTLLGLGACGGDDDGGSGGTPAQPGEGGGGSVTEQLFAGSASDNRADPGAGKKGGKLTVLSGGDADYMDPGKTYYSYAIGIMNAIHRGLYAYAPDKLRHSGPRGRDAGHLGGRQDRHREDQGG